MSNLGDILGFGGGEGRTHGFLSLFNLGKQLYFLVTPSAPRTFDILTF